MKHALQMNEKALLRTTTNISLLIIIITPTAKKK